jgi:glycosyltransferase involved in cell wall biosynthesis
MSYLDMNIPQPDEVFPRNSFVSICIPTFCRPYYVRRLLNSIPHPDEDMRYEVIVSDDGSSKSFRDEIRELADERKFLLVENAGWNVGLPESANRCIALASSEYVLFLNDDCYFVGKCLKDLCNILSKPYIGWVSPMNDIGGFGLDVCSTEVNGTKFAITNFLGGGATLGFRKSVWQEVGGWDYKATSGQADNVFVYKIARSGYFKAVLEGPPKIGDSNHDEDYIPTQPLSRGNDCSIPKIFGISDEEWIRINHKRRIACQYWVDGERTVENRQLFDNRQNPIAGLNDHPYWGNYFLDMFGGGHCHDVRKIDWQVAERHGQHQWKDEIYKDFQLAQ